jgi:hypothetical protein
MTALVTSQPTRSTAARAEDSLGEGPGGDGHRVGLIDVLAPYPHVARCTACRSYALDGLTAFTPDTVLSATLAHHDSAHRCDPLSAASEYFGFDASS